MSESRKSSANRAKAESHRNIEKPQRFERLSAFSLLVSIFSLLVAASSLVIAWQSYRHRVTESLMLDLDQFFFQSEKIVVHDPGIGRDGSFRCKWGCVISNNGEQPVSINRIYVESTYLDGNSTVRYTPFAASERGDVFTINTDRIMLPITLQPGEAKYYLVPGTIPVQSRAVQALRGRGFLDRSVFYQEISSALMQARLGLRGNLAHFDTRTGATYYENKSPIRQFRQCVYVETTRGLRFNKCQDRTNSF